MMSHLKLMSTVLAMLALTFTLTACGLQKTEDGMNTDSDDSTTVTEVESNDVEEIEAVDLPETKTIYRTESDIIEKAETPVVVEETVGYSPALYMPVMVQRVEIETKTVETKTVTPVEVTGDDEVELDHEAETTNNVLSEATVHGLREVWIEPKGFEKDAVGVNGLSPMFGE